MNYPLPWQKINILASKVIGTAAKRTVSAWPGSWPGRQKPGADMKKAAQGGFFRQSSD